MYRPLIVRRYLATSAESITKQQQFNVFDRSAKLVQRTRIAKLNPELSRKKEYLRDEVALKTIERLAFITRDFTKVLDFGSHSGNLLKNLCIDTEIPPGADYAETEITKQLNNDKKIIQDKIKQLYLLDSSSELLYRDIKEPFNQQFKGEVIRCVADEETFDHDCLKESDQYDAVISNLSLHWINDLPQTLANINRVLKPDGLFMGTLFGGDTLYELRTSLQLAELERKGGISPRVSPLVHLNDIGSLLNRAGFSMLTIDAEDVIVGGFPDIVSVCEDLQAMGEQNAVLSRANTLPRDVLLAANEIYKSLHGETDADGKVTLPATFNIIFMIGWKKSETQPQPLARGSGQVNLKDVL
ncbi:S-adenosyl-L-methionine-dependent methyltransferase [Scheffersomyces coipomensis]|uniref:S-adenosyl-L-methionine-dependent methyltransferase n=1 Tax=Scheffersomyces coipomensis TaxID=1788519 RepID=UPI00315C9FED